MLRPLDVLQRYRSHDYTLADALASRRAACPEKVMLIHEGEAITWDRFADRCAEIERLLQGQGVRAGDRVAIMARNHPMHVVALFALAGLGAILVPINPDFGVEEARYAAALADISGIIVSDETRAVALRAMAGCSSDLFVMNTGGTIETASPRRPAPAGRKPLADPEAVCVIIFTSGTTGFPKGVMHSQRSFLLAGEAFVERMHLQPDDRLMIVLPLFHMNALFYSVSGTVAAGASAVIVPKFSASRFWAVAEETGATIVNLIEAMGNILKARPRSEFRPGHRLRAAYGVRQSSADVFRDDFKIPTFFSGFGMTEIPGVTSNPHGRENKPGSMGVPGRHPDPGIAWARCRVVDDAFQDVAPGTVGELVVDTPIVMKGYFRDEGQTKAAFHGPWFRTGDLVRRDEDGFYFYVSRRKDIIRRRGENIAGAELDRVISAHPKVAQAAVIATPSELGEDEIFAVVVKLDGAALGEADIAEWCAKHLSPHKVPRFVAFVPALPMTPTHKVAKDVLRRDAALRRAAIDLAQAL